MVVQRRLYDGTLVVDYSVDDIVVDYQAFVIAVVVVVVVEEKDLMLDKLKKSILK
jgi:hypothetical protein